MPLAVALKRELPARSQLQLVGALFFHYQNSIVDLTLVLEMKAFQAHEHGTTVVSHC